ncbi:ATP-binding protein [Cellulomonas sp. KRMCY2]|uniref:ATP-binding protein n=1 Tax=Cellulomonas sp. KRMCY2 TaxID=1304865 RepID=UPI00045EAE9D|nr:ATP-binding protein [Cellulomonas sp. KRMCY2]
MTAPARIQGPGPDGTDAPTSEGTAPVAVPRPTAAQLLDHARDEWRAALVARAGDSALADVDRLGDAQLDLSAAHPSGIAQLFAGRPTRLSNLVREGSALSAAKRRARSVGAAADDHAQRYGLVSAFLAIGVATWTEQAAGDPVVDVAGVGALADAAVPRRTAAPAPDAADRPTAARTVHAPVLLRPVAITPRGRGESDYDLTLEPSLEINPLLATALRSRGALLDPTALARGAFTASGFDPQPALERLRALGAAVLTGFSLDERLLVGNFVHPEQTLVDDLDAQGPTLHRHEVLTALAGDQRSIDALAHPLPPMLRGDRPLDQERGIGDLDAAQTHVLDAVAAGHHLLVDAPSGSDVSATLAAMVADAAACGRTVLYVAGHRRAATALTARLAALGLDELVLDIAPDSGWRARAGRRLLGAMTVEPVVVDAAKVEVVQSELLVRRRRLKGYIDALHTTREPWGASAYDALQALARLTAGRPTPQTTVRLTAPVAESLNAERRAQAANDLVRAAGLGAFSDSARATPWYGADLQTADRARAAVRRLEHLLDDALPRLADQVAQVADATGLTRATTPAQWAEQLEMLAGVRSALDVFQPIVFERSASDMVAATAPREWRAEHGIEMSATLRRRLRKQAKDLVRPGRPVADLHAALVHVQAQREVWQAHCPAGGWPRIPDGLATIEVDHREVLADLDALSEVLAGTPAGGRLADLTWSDLGDRLRRLRLDRAALDTLPERTALVRSLDRRGLGALLTDLAERRVSAGLVSAELELAWWSTVFEEILLADPALAGYDGAALARLVAEFRALDRRHLEDRALLARAAAREALRLRLRAADEQTQALFGEIVEDRFTSLRLAVERYPDVARHLRPCLVASPMLVPYLLPATRTEDLVILDAAGHLPLESVVSALARGRQVVVIGDTRCTSGTALVRLAQVLPSVVLHADTSRRDPHLTTFLADHGYAGRLTATPLPATTALLRLDVVDGSGMPAANGAVEGTRAEVEHVVGLVVDHALTRPDESLAVVTASPVHAERVREAVMAEVRDNSALERFFRPDQAEPFVVVEVGATQGLSREAVIFSIGFGRTPHGRVLHRFGALSEPGGQGRLLETLGATRHRLTVVSCFTAEDLDPDRLRAPGARLLADLVELVAEHSDVADGVDRTAPTAAGPEPDRLVLDLAERLWRRGLVVDLDHGVRGGARIPLVAGHPDLPDEMLVAVLTDDEAYVGEPSVRVRDRQAAERLERLGWTVVQVWSAAVFLDPQAEADAIHEAVLAACARRLASRPAGPTTRSVRGHVQEATDAQAAVGIAASADPQGAGATDPAPAHGPRPAAHGAVPGGRPDVEPGLPISAYSDDQLDDLMTWIRSDGVERDDEQLAGALRAELGIVRRGSRIDAAVNGAVRRSR